MTYRTKRRIQGDRRTQGHREKLSVTIAPGLYEIVERHAERAKMPKSRIIEEAIHLWERSRLAALAREGYQQLGDEDRADAEAYLPALDELWEG
jgi:hypothetical protein